MKERPRREDRWQHLVTAAALLEQGADADELLASALEVFSRSVDPVEDFEGYAVRRFLLALEDSLRR